jgi:hypothetical protein
MEGVYAAYNNGGDVWPIQHPSVVRGNYNIIYIKYMASHQYHGYSTGKV